MANSSTYLSSPSRARKKSIGKNPFAIFALMLVALVTMFGSALSTFGANKVETASAWDPVQWVICQYPEGSLPRMGYTATQTSDIQFDLFSKSVVTAGRDDVDFGLNWILSISGMDFNKVNESVIGQPLEKGGADLGKKDDAKEPTEEELKKNFNKGAKVSIFDRFGMAGTTFTSYNGEWRHYKIDPCSDKDPVDLKAGAYYDDRLEPRSTWEDIGTSTDARTIQFDKGATARFWTGFVTLMANMLFWVTKFITTVTIAFINFSFTDIIKVMGIDALLTGDSNAGGGIIQMLFKNLYSPLIVLMMLLAGIRIFYQGIFKRQFRTAMTTAIVSVLLFILSIFVAANPKMFISLPNNVAVTVQTVIVKAFSGTLANGDTICSTDVGIKPLNIQSGAGKAKDDQAYIDKVSKNMGSAVGCVFWSTFVFQPWAEGQFGVPWNETWAKGGKAKWAPSGSKELQNHNSDMVGKAAVPVGGGKFINNWAIYNMSTLTNAHAPTGHDGSLSKHSNGVSNDWWRIVDALTDYQEKTASELPPQADGGDKKIEYTVSKDNPPLATWDNWSGNSPWTRFGAAFSSLFIGGFGLFAPMLFSLMAAVYSIAMSLAMVVTPVMLLLGAWGGRGFNIFKQWLLSIWQLFIKRIGTGVLLMFSIVLTNAAIIMMRNVGWWQGAFMMVLLTVILISSRHKIMAVFTASSGGGSFYTTGKKVSDKVTSAGKAVGSIAVGAASGAAYSMSRGGSLMDGLKAGADSAVLNESYKSPFLRQARLTEDVIRSRRSPEDGIRNSFSGDEDGKNDGYCAVCGERFDNYSTAYSSAGLMYCQMCAEAGYAPKDAQEVMIDTDARSKLDNLALLKSAKNAKPVPKVSLLNDDTAQQVLNDGDYTDPSTDQKLIGEVKMRAISPIISKVEGIQKGEVDPRSLSRVPNELKAYISQPILQEAVNKKDWEYVATALGLAYATWIQDMLGRKVENMTNEIIAEIQSREVILKSKVNPVNQD